MYSPLKLILVATVAFLAALVAPLGADASEALQLPYSVEGPSSLESVARSLGATGTQVIDLGHDMSIMGVYMPTGSGMVTLDAYIYKCEPLRCTLHAFITTGKQKLVLALEDNATELVVKSTSGMTVMRMPTPGYR